MKTDLTVYKFFSFWKLFGRGVITTKLRFITTVGVRTNLRKNLATNIDIWYLFQYVTENLKKYISAVQSYIN